MKIIHYSCFRLQVILFVLINYISNARAQSVNSSFTSTTTSATTNGNNSSTIVTTTPIPSSTTSSLIFPITTTTIGPNNTLINSSSPGTSAPSTNVTKENRNSSTAADNAVGIPPPQNVSVEIDLVPNEKLQLRLEAMEEAIVFTVKINLQGWNWWELRPKANMSKDEEEFPNNDTLLKTLLIGFETDDATHKMFLDVISIPLNGDDEKDLHVKDSHWSKKDKVLIPDSIQNYELVSFDVGKNHTMFLIKFSRPWTTCDDYDVHLANTPLKIWWILDAVPDTPEKSSSTTAPTAPPKLANLENAPSSTMAYNSEAKGEITTSTLPSVTLTNTTSTPRILVNSTASIATTLSASASSDKPKENATEGKANPSEKTGNATLAKEVEVLRFLKYQEFNGPFNVSMGNLFNNFSYVAIKNCGSSESPTYKCSLKELESRSFDHSHFYVIGGIRPRSGALAPKKKFNEKESDFCPSDDLLHGNSTTVNALTSTSDKRQGRGNAMGFHNKNFWNNFPIWLAMGITVHGIFSQIS